MGFNVLFVAIRIREYDAGVSQDQHFDIPFRMPSMPGSVLQVTLPPMEDAPNADPRVAALLGEALRLMSESGSSPSSMGEFALSYPSKIVKILGAPPPRPAVVNLEDAIQSAVERALSKKPAFANPSEARTRVVVIIGGQRTSVSIRSDLIIQADEAMGGKARDTIRSLANQSWPNQGNRSGWIESQLEQLLLFRRVRGDIEMRH